MLSNCFLIKGTALGVIEFTHRMNTSFHHNIEYLTISTLYISSLILFLFIPNTVFKSEKEWLIRPDNSLEQNICNFNV